MKKILVAGTGQMGGGIIQAALQGGYQVNAYDVAAAPLAALKPKIGKAFAKLKEKGKADDAQINGWLNSLTVCDSLEAAAADVDLVIEAATEDVDLKIGLFKKLDELCAESAILASNTSSISITKIASATKRPEKVTGMHFFNPVPVMKLLEIIPGLYTSEETCGACRALGEKLGKTVVRVNIDSPGFVVNRLLIPMINEAVLVLQEGITNAESIDKAMSAGANHPMGPLALSDLIGNDTVLAIMQVLYNEFQDPKYRPALLLKRMVAAGKLGRKSGKGFFQY
ncbi:MAG: 3-hydroxybutyryl-CoA dehydrogenase [Acidaminococcales bacterium]|nr:3-hydroxybutyryl-CoA dehydrogenase [Acidaminococcales bacterium]